MVKMNKELVFIFYTLVMYLFCKGNIMAFFLYNQGG